ncbi:MULTISPECIES: ISAzo13 family transposase [unclassified Bradyrhizobium]|uniref:ISAzo13 family transposase n=1 Tax=unclassified Bradyrhizobium TaxID=2631580 RepID=UPI0028EFFC55|nr:MULTISPECIES: ISAzo13 family transposase [unclassified Bradyrhizobium]
MAKGSDIRMRWQLLSPYLNRSQRSLWAAAEAEAIGCGGVALVSGATGISHKAISTGVLKVRATKCSAAGSLVPTGGSSRSGRKLTEVSDPQIEQVLQKMLSEEVAGDPMSQQRWVRSSTRNLSRRLGEQGHKACHHTVARLLRKMGYSLRVNWRKRDAGAQHPDRDEQFKYIAVLKDQYIREQLPVISVDTKKKELIGNFRREGKSWRRQPVETEPHFASYAKCVAVPFGIYDINKNKGYVTVGTSNNTSAFAVHCLETWWCHHGRSFYPHRSRLLILADSGGANGYNLRTWKKDLQEKLCDACGLTVTVCHYPPGCSKWNPVEYRLFSHISMNWAGQPLRSLEVMLAFIRGTTTTAGLTVEAQLDQTMYLKGRKVTERQLTELAVSAHDICPCWNYTLTPRSNS